MSRVSTEIYTENSADSIKAYTEQAIECCINSWNQLCPEYQIPKDCIKIKKKRRLSIESDCTVIDTCNNSRNIAKIKFSIDKRLTAKSLQKNSSSPKVFITCRIWWNHNGYHVRGWSNNIEFDVNKGCISSFPQIIQCLPHWETQM